MAQGNRFDGPVGNWPGPHVACVCGARAGYRIVRRGDAPGRGFDRCPACARNYSNDKYDAEPLPHVRDAFEDLIYASYRNQRDQFPHVTPERWAASFRETFGPRIVELEARYQAELQRRAS